MELQVIFFSAHAEQMSLGNGGGYLQGRKEATEKRTLMNTCYHGRHFLVCSADIFNTVAVRLKTHYSVDTGLENQKTGLKL